MTNRRRTGFATWLGGVCAGLVCQAGTWYVSPLGGDAGHGAGWPSAQRTIQAAVDLAVAGDTVLVTNGVYALSRQVTIEKPVEVRSVNGPSTTIVQGRPGVRCFALTHAAANLAGFTITNGQVAAYQNGGGVWSRGIIRDCVIAGNQAPTGSGGGLYNLGEARNCVITGNTAGDCGGGVYNQGLLRNCLIAGNTGGNGGGVFNFSDSLIESCTIVRNTSDHGGVNNYGEVRNSILYSNVYGNILSLYGNGSDQVRYCCVTPAPPGEGNVAENPRLTADDRLAEGSPCINAGANQPWMRAAGDLGGAPRISDDRVDIGAYEFKPR